MRQARFPILALAGAALCSLTLFAQNPTPPDKRPPMAGPQADPKAVMKETKGKSALKAHGLEAHALHGREAGKPVSDLPGAKGITRAQLAAMKNIPKTGLYLLDMDHIPAGLEMDLKARGYVLAKDGTLTQNGKPVLLVIHGETFKIGPPKAASGLMNSLDGMLAQVLDASGSLLATDAQAASPFPWACGSWYFSWHYNGGFCRDYEAWSNAYAWGPGPGGGCSDPKPLTHIQYISTYAAIGSHTGFDYHYNADQSHAYAKWDIGCFWPAHGTASGYHYAYWQDGGAWMYRTWSW